MISEIGYEPTEIFREIKFYVKLFCQQVDFTEFLQKVKIRKRGVRLVGFSNVGLPMKLKKSETEGTKKTHLSQKWKYEKRGSTSYFLMNEKKVSNFNLSYVFVSFHQLYCTTFIFFR